MRIKNRLVLGVVLFGCSASPARSPAPPPASRAPQTTTQAPQTTTRAPAEQPKICGDRSEDILDEALGHGSRRWMERLETGNLQKPHLFPPNDATITLECGRIREYRITHIALQHSLHGQMVTDVSCNGELVAFAVDEMIDVPYDDPRSEAEIEELQRVEVDYFFYRGSGEFRRVVRTDHGVDPPQVTTTEDSVPIGDHDQRAAALRTACDSQRGRRYPPGLDLIDVGPR